MSIGFWITESDADSCTNRIDIDLLVHVYRKVFEKKPTELLEHPKAHSPQREDETYLSVMAAKAERSNEIAYGQTLSAYTMGNQQRSSE